MRRSSRSRRLLLMARGEIEEKNTEPQRLAESCGSLAAGYNSYHNFPDLKSCLADDELFQYPVQQQLLPENFEPPKEYENSYQYLQNVDYDALKTNLCTRPESEVVDESNAYDKENVPSDLSLSALKNVEPNVSNTKLCPRRRLCFVDDSDASDKGDVSSELSLSALENVGPNVSNTKLCPRPDLHFVDDSDASDKDNVSSDMFHSTLENVESNAFNSNLSPSADLDFVEDSDDSVKDKDYVPSDASLLASDNDENVPDGPRSSVLELQASTSQVSIAPTFQNDLGLTKAGKPRKRRQTEMTVTERAEQNQDSKRIKHQVIIEEHLCTKRCSEIISGSERENINRAFWNMSWREQKLFIAQRITCKEPERRRNQISENKRTRNKTLTYSLKVSGQTKQVCKAFFLNTLGFKKDNHSAIVMALKSDEDPDLCDQRGKNPKKKIDRAPIQDHIKSYKPAISHYRREHAPNRRYLPSDLSAQQLYNDYCETNGKTFSYDLYRETIKSMNISFAKLGEEECDQCQAFTIHNPEHMILRHYKCKICKDYDTHVVKAKNARIKYQSSESNDETKYYSADLQKVIMLPRMEGLKSVMFCPRLIAFNESFVPVGATKDLPLAVLWHEAIAGRKKEDIICAFKLFFTEVRDIKNIVLWLDNCAAQNKNWCLLSYLIYLINSEEVVTETITLKYFEPGHTFMSADSFHHQVELSMKKMKKIYDFKDFITAVENANNGKVKAKDMKITDSFIFKDCTAPKKISTAKPRPYLHEIVEIQFTKGEYTLYYKTSFEGETIRLDFLKPGIIKNGFPPLIFKNEPRGITSKRKEDIIQRLGRLMPANRLQFWKTLPINEKSTNLIEEHGDD